MQSWRLSKVNTNKAADEPFLAIGLLKPAQLSVLHGARRNAKEAFMNIRARYGAVAAMVCLLVAEIAFFSVLEGSSNNALAQYHAQYGDAADLPSQ
jgi:hypothetical protein